jgi:hypothetical protein
MPYIIGLIVIVLIGVGFTLLQNQTADQVTIETPIEVTRETETTPTTITPAETVPANDPVESATNYTDGTYTSEVSYLTPARNEYFLDITLTLQNDVIVESNVAYRNGAEKDPNPKRFEGAYRSQVIGKSLDQVSLSRVGGASLTTNAFNEALVEIKAQAAT